MLELQVKRGCQTEIKMDIARGESDNGMRPHDSGNHGGATSRVSRR